MELRAFDADQLWRDGLKLLFTKGNLVTQRGGQSYRLPEPIAIRIARPQAVLLQCPVRNANPFMTFFEALWVLAGRNDIGFLEQFVPRVREFSDDGVTWRGGYGPRLRSHFGRDQLKLAVDLLAKSPESNHAVLGIWDPSQDGLGVVSKDHPCNDMVMLSVTPYDTLDMTVVNRSNDLVWGLCPNNLTTFSMIMQYVACKIGKSLGTYTHFSNNLHIYTSVPKYQKYEELAVSTDPVVRSQNLHIGAGHPNWDIDLESLFNWWEDSRWSLDHPPMFYTAFFRQIVLPMVLIHPRRSLAEATEAAKSFEIHPHVVQDAMTWRLRQEAIASKKELSNA